MYCGNLTGQKSSYTTFYNQKWKKIKLTSQTGYMVFMYGEGALTNNMGLDVEYDVSGITNLCIGLSGNVTYTYGTIEVY